MHMFEIKYYIGKLLFNMIVNDHTHAWHTVAVHECVNGIDYYYIRA